MSHGDLPLAFVLGYYHDGDDHGWPTEFADLRTRDALRIASLTVDIAANGIREPILIGSDGRVWDGHHRLCVAHALQLATVPVEFARAGRAAGGAA